MKQLICVLFVVVTAVTAKSQTIEKDKQLHYAAGILSGAVGYNFVYEKTKDKNKALAAGVITSILAGVAKETYDSTRPGNKFDTKDLAATTLGGITISVTIKLFKNVKNNKKVRKRHLELLVE